jgi:hypothetical protein
MSTEKQNEAPSAVSCGGFVRPYRGRRCPDCYWALYDGDWCQNKGCRSAGESPGVNAMRLSNEEAALLIAANLHPHGPNKTGEP